MNDELIRTLQKLGFNAVEAEVYLSLLTNNGSTAYRLGKIINKPTANVYKAIDTLAQKGAVMIEAAETQLCYAVEPNQFLQHQVQESATLADKARTLLLDFTSPLPVGKVFQLESAALIISRAKMMLKSARHTVVIDAFPRAMAAIRTDIYSAMNRGVEIHIQHYVKEEWPNVHSVFAHDSDKVLKFWSSEQLNLVTDGEQCLIALLNETISEVHQAVWSDSLYLSCMMQMGLMREHCFHQLMAETQGAINVDKIHAILHQQIGFHESAVPGQVALFQRFLKNPTRR